MRRNMNIDWITPPRYDFEYGLGIIDGDEDGFQVAEIQKGGKIKNFIYLYNSDIDCFIDKLKEKKNVNK